MLKEDLSLLVKELYAAARNQQLYGSMGDVNDDFALRAAGAVDGYAGDGASVVQLPPSARTLNI